MEPQEIFKVTYSEDVYSVQSPLTVVMGVPWEQVGADHRLLLSKILNSVRLSLAGVRIIQQTNLDVSAWGEKPRQIIAFLAPPKGLPCYEVIQTGEASVIFSDPLEILNSDDAAKRQLWNALKSHFIG